LPHASYCSAQPGAMREDAIRIAISRDGRMYLNRSAVPLEDLPKLIREEVSAGSERKVYISVDSRAGNSDPESVLDRSVGRHHPRRFPHRSPREMNPFHPSRPKWIPGQHLPHGLTAKTPHPSAVSPATHVMIEQTSLLSMWHASRFLPHCW
jgi:hypothetical protein